MSNGLLVARGQQVVGLLLSTVPLAERMLLYQAAMTAWVMFPQRSVLESTFLACRGRLGFSRQPNPIRS
jgi:hypothetical protein